MVAKQIAPGIKTGNETRYGLAEASRLSGIPVSRFRYTPNKQKLIDAGTTVDSSGWSIPVSALTSLGWLPGSGEVNTPTTTPAKPGVKRDVNTPERDELLDQLRSENAYLREQLSIQTQTTAELSRAHAIISGQLAQLEALPRETPTEDQPRTPRRWWKRS